MAMSVVRQGASITGDTTPRIRRAGPADADDLVNLFASVYLHSSHPFQDVTTVSTFLSDPRNVQIIAEVETGVVASAAMTYSPWNDSYELGRALTHPTYRGKGVAAALLQTVVDRVCKAGRGQIFYGFPRVRRIAEICSQLNPRMVIVGHDAGRNVANGAREVHLINVGITPNAPSLHVAPYSNLAVCSEFVHERIYQPLGLHPICNRYPAKTFIGDIHGAAAITTCGEFVVDHDPRLPNHALEILGYRDQTANRGQACRQLDQCLSTFPGIEHVTATILADKISLIRELCDRGFQVAAYIPAWYRCKGLRFDCVQLLKRLYQDAVVQHDLTDILNELVIALGSLTARY